MRTQNIFLIFEILIMISFIQLVNSEPEQLHITGGICSTYDNITANGTYHDNIFSLLSKLTSRSTQTRFTNFSIGTGSNRVNGLYLCRSDISLDTCGACVNTSTDFLLTLCNTKKEAIVWYEECMLRYSNRSIFATEETTPARWYFGYLNVSQPEVFSGLLNRTMEGLIVQAALPSNTLRFATGKANYTAFEGLYGMVQCTPDITGLECWDCLTTALGMIPTCCGGVSVFTTVALPSCQLMYDTAPFIIAPPPTTLSSSPSPAPSPLPID